MDDRTSSLPSIENPGELSIWSRMVGNELGKLTMGQTSNRLRIELLERELALVKNKAAMVGAALSGVLMIAFEITKWLVEKK